MALRPQNLGGPANSAATNCRKLLRKCLELGHPSTEMHRNRAWLAVWPAAGLSLRVAPPVAPPPCRAWLAVRPAEEEARAEAQLRAEWAAREAREAAAQQGSVAVQTGTEARPRSLLRAGGARDDSKAALVCRGVEATPVAEAAPRVPPLALSQIAGAPLVAATVVPQCDAQGGQDAPAAAPRSGRGAAQAPPWSTPESARRRQQHSLQQREDKGCMFSPGRPECMGRSGSQQCSQQ
ncbi:unnamed protein product [Prorocentrum cordatum]|uniref:Uncharacterized protein n=1 Tax=Prorocentrum cordatum TaxID=2364126 RepID=A0ABN9UNZ6_9DINO|nr:unnamed protein product [Polarella glacialis]